MNTFTLSVRSVGWFWDFIYIFGHSISGPHKQTTWLPGGENKQNQPFLHGNKMKWNFPSGTGGGNLNPPTAECDVERRGRKARLYGSKGPAVRGTGRKTTILKEDVVVSLHGPTDVGQRGFQNSRVDPARPQKREHGDFFSSLREKPKNFHILLWQHVGKIEPPSSSSGRRGLYFTPSSKAPSTRGGGAQKNQESTTSSIQPNYKVKWMKSLNAASIPSP